MPQASCLLDPAKDLRDSLPGIDRLGVALMAAVRPTMAELLRVWMVWATWGVMPLMRR